MSEIKTYEVEHSGRGDSGDTYTFRCPECGQEITCSSPLSEWWDTTCQCGYKWSVSVVATGQKWD